MKKTLLFALISSLALNVAATTFTVVSSDDGTTTDGVSLRWAITQSNAYSADTIAFDIPGMAPHTINLLTALPSINFNAVVIDGTTQPANGYTGSDPKIILRDSAGISDGLYFLVTYGAKVRGIWIRDFDEDGIYIFGSAVNATVEQCKVTNNGVGIYVLGSLAYGGIVRSIVSDNITYGIYLIGSSAWIDVSESQMVSNGSDGILALGAGAWSIITNNLVSGNAGNGISVEGVGSRITGNKIGTDSTGMNAWGNALNGINNLYESNDTIGGFGPGDGNIIAYNTGAGVAITGSYNLISRNSIFCNGTSGIYLSGFGNNGFASPVILIASQSGASGTATANSMVELFSTPLPSSCPNCEGETWIASVMADASGNWTYNGAINGGQSISATAIDTGNYNTSEFSDCVEILATSVFETSSATSLNIFPNPATDEIFLDSKFSSGSRLELFDATGRSVMAIVLNSNSESVNVASLPRGIYFYKLTEEKNENAFSGTLVLQ